MFELAVEILYLQIRNFTDEIDSTLVMKYLINKKKDGLHITIDEVENKKDSLLKAFQECQEGRCSCPTEEYKKLESLEIEQNKDGIQLQLKALDGLMLDVNEIQKCMEYTTKKVEKEG